MTAWPWGANSQYKTMNVKKQPGMKDTAWTDWALSPVITINTKVWSLCQKLIFALCCLWLKTQVQMVRKGLPRSDLKIAAVLEVVQRCKRRWPWKGNHPTLNEEYFPKFCVNLQDFVVMPHMLDDRLSLQSVSHQMFLHRYYTSTVLRQLLLM